MKTALYAAWCCAALFARGPATAEDYVLSCEPVRGRLLGPVSVNGAECPFLIDACLQQSVIAAETAAAGNLPRETPPEGLPKEAVLVRIESLGVAGMPPHAATAIVMDLSAFTARLGRPILGLLPLHQPGLEATVNFHDAAVTWRPLEKARLTKTDLNTVAITFDETGAPAMPVLIHGQRLLNLQIDLARAGTLGLPRRILGELGALSGERPQLRTIMDERRVQTQIRLDSIKAAGATLVNPICTLLDTDEPGWVGLGFLRHFQVTINFEHGLIRLENAQRNVFEDPPITGAGLTPENREGAYWQVQVAENGPAWRAGLRTGDVLTAINGHSLADVSAEHVTALLLAPEGTLLHCAYTRGSVSAEAPLTAERLL